MAVFWLKKRPKKAKIQKTFFCSIFLLGSIYIPNFRKFHQTVWILPICFIFGQFSLFLVEKRPKKAEIQLLKSTYIPNFRKFHQTVWILPIFFIFVNFGRFLAKKGQKRPKSKNGLCGEFSFTKRHLHTKFQKISSNGSQDNLWRKDGRTDAQRWIYRSRRFETGDQQA